MTIRSLSTGNIAHLRRTNHHITHTQGQSLCNVDISIFKLTAWVTVLRSGNKKKKTLIYLNQSSEMSYQALRIWINTA